ncbi:glycosyltransferase family 2 protein [Bacteroides fragilis]|uniref:glycosyltransferase n=1 Tax=Bacteroides fragilis TaxID=817 RepID=UPI001C6FF4CA|nr:glycosyltransferase family 2 protein [Bacteroides fragilis]MBW9276420.1 glycosyltransferase family 2 protein [Bacteroides fragilis]
MILTLIDWILFIPLALCVSYLLVYAIASKFYRSPIYPEADKLHRIAVFFPAYKEDKVIIDSVRSFLEQDYPKEMYDVYVISDHMQDSTNEALRQLPIRLLTATYEDSSKAKALLLAIRAIQEDGKASGLSDYRLAYMYDIAVVMDADNVTVPGFLSEVNRAYSAGVKSMQAHRVGKNLNTDIALLDGVSEEINNGFFRKGHNVLGLSAGLAGSGMAFQYSWYYEAVDQLKTAGEDKELELLLIEYEMHTVYLDHLPVYDEKTQKKENIKNQRRRWMAAQFSILLRALRFVRDVKEDAGWWRWWPEPDLTNKIVQWMLPPRLVQLTAVFGLTLLATLVNWQAAPKWWVLSAAQVAAMFIPVPARLLNGRLLKALMQVPSLALGTIANLFRLKGANKKFIHTEHGE